MTVEVPRGFHEPRYYEAVPSTSLGYALAFCLLTTAALAMSSLHTWECYTMGCHIFGIAVPRWQTVGFLSFLSAFVASWVSSQVQNHINLRRQSFDEVFSE